MNRPILILSALALLLAPQAAGAQGIEPYQAQSVQPQQAQIVKPYRSQGIKPYKSKTVRPLTKAERAQMNRRTMAGYHRSKRGQAPQGLTEAQIKAYGTLNHNIGVWNSGQDFTMQSN